MTVFFLVVLVLLITVVAMVATGRISRPPAAQHDQRPSHVPTAPLSVESLQSVRFSIAFRGYRMDQVDALIRQMQDTLNPPPADGLVDAAANTGGNDNAPDGHTE